MTLYTYSDRQTSLSENHRQQLEEGSGISPEVTAERGVSTVTEGRQLPKGFSRRQRRRGPGILFTIHRPNGETSHSFRPDELDPKNPGHKYEQPAKSCGGPGNVLDIHPSLHHLISDPDVPVIFVEGIKKSDSILSAARAAGVEVLVMAVSGVWNWLSDGEPIPDMAEIPVEGRPVTILFDSDLLRNEQVQDAARRLAGYLISHGAEVFITYLSDQADGSKAGADDFLAGGGTLQELRLLTRRYDPADFERVRLSRDEKLRAAVEDLERTFWGHAWKGQGGHTDRDVYLKLIEAARRHGKLVEGGVRVTISHGTLALQAKASTRTVWKSLNRLEGAELIYRDNEGRKPDKSGAFVLNASVRQYGTGTGAEGKETPELQTLYARTLHLRSPRLRWSQPKYTPRRGVVRGTRKVRQAPPATKPRPAIKRLGKIRGAVVDALDAAGGAATLEEVAAALHRKDPRELVRCKTKPGGRNGPVIMLLETRIVEWVCDVESGREVLRLTDNWLEALENQRRLGGEIEAEEAARTRYKEKSRAYHNRHKVKADSHWTNDPSADGAIEGLRPADEPEPEKPEPQANPAAAAVLDYVNRLGKIRMGLLEQIWLEDHGGDLKELRRAVEESGVRKERLREYRDAVFLYPPAKPRAAA